MSTICNCTKTTADSALGYDQIKHTMFINISSSINLTSHNDVSSVSSSSFVSHLKNLSINESSLVKEQDNIL